MTARQDESANFVQGIHNYCDRWCERCKMTSRCMLFSEMFKRRNEYIALGEDPDDWDIQVADLESDLKETLELICSDALEHGLDLDEILGEQERLDLSDHPLRSKAEALSWSIHRFREKATKLIFEELLKSYKDSDVAAQSDAVDVLEWYEFQFTVKIDRALRSILQKRTENDDLFDANASAKVAWIGLTRCMDSLAIIDQALPWMHAETIPLFEGIHEVVHLLDEIIPGHKTVKRPGFET